MIGKTISQYKILEKLGEGGMGVVYKAEDTKLDRFVALKFLPPHLGQSEEEKKRFIHEAKAASALDHNNICTIYEINETEDGQMFIAMAYYEGETLKAMTERGPLALEQAIDIAMQVAQGLARAHEEKIVHRDLKPANIMITNRGEVKIVDFGLAKLSGRTLLTKEGTTLGTVAYMSPEQTQGSDVDHRTDIWSLGVVLYEMLTGEQPFKGDYEQAVMYSIMNENPEPPTALRSGVPMELEHIILKALATEPSERYQHIDEMAVDLNALQKTVETRNRKRGQTTVGTGRKRSLTRSKWPIFIGGFVIVALLAILATYLFNSLESDSITAEKSIAVLPFTDMSPLKDQEYFGDGMAEEIINALARIPGLKVSARTSAFQFKGRDSDIQTIGEKLGVGTVLEGSVRKYGNKLRVTAQLINVSDGFHLWSDTYERELTDVFFIQDDLSSSIVAALKVKLSGEETASIRTRKHSSVEAYNLYLKGRYFWNKRTAETMQESIDYFQQALDIDPTYALAYVGLADAYNMLGTWQALEPNETFMKVQAAAQKALEIDDTLAEAHTALAWFKFIYNWDWLGAEREFLRALELNPNYATAHQWYAMFLGTRGRHDEARVEIRKAMELDPLSLIINGVSGWLYQWAGQYDEAIMQGQKTLEMDPHYIPTHFWLFDWYLEKGMWDEAFTHFMGHYPSHFDLTRAEAEILQTLYKDSGWSGVGRFMIDKLKVMSRERYVSPSQISLYYIMAKDYTRALDYLEKAYQIRSAQMIYLGVQAKIKYKALHSEPRFQALLKKIDLPQ